MSITWRNKLYCGDNLDILRKYVADESVDLVYLDPPFNSNATYNVLFREESGALSKAQEEAFEDTWRWGHESEATFHHVMTEGPAKVGELLAAFRLFLGQNQMMAYLTMMTARLIELHRVLKATGSLYLHCDPTASHYLKILLDGTFGVDRFLNEITWKRVTSHSDAKRWSPVADHILVYTKSALFTWNPQYTALDAEYVAKKYVQTEDDGRPYQLHDMTSPSPRPNMMYEWMGFKSPEKGWRFSKETMAKLHMEDRIWYPEDKNKRGVIRFFDDGTGLPKQAVIQVKSGHVQAAHVRDLKGVMEREKAPIGALVSLERPSKAMEKEALSAGFYTPRVGAKPVPRLQLLTIEGLLSGREQIQYHPLPPPLPRDTEPGKTPKRPPRRVEASKSAPSGYEQGELLA